MRPYASRARWLLHLRDRLPGAAAVGERTLGFSARRPLPRWHREASIVRGPNGLRPGGDGRDVVLFADTFTTWFEPDNARAAVAVLEAAGLPGARARAHPIGDGAVLRPDFLSRGARGRGAARDAGNARGIAPLRRARRARGRPGALVPAHHARRVHRAAARAARPTRSRRRRCCSRSSCGASTRPDDCACRCARTGRGGRWCTATAIKRRSARWRR